MDTMDTNTDIRLIVLIKSGLVPDDDATHSQWAALTSEEQNAVMSLPQTAPALDLLAWAIVETVRQRSEG